MENEQEVGRAQFIGWIADRFQQRHTPPLPRADALQMGADALEAFEDMGAPFGHSGFGWDEDGAHAVADEEIHAGWESAE